VVPSRLSDRFPNGAPRRYPHHRRGCPFGRPAVHGRPGDGGPALGVRPERSVDSSAPKKKPATEKPGGWPPSRRSLLHKRRPCQVASVGKREKCGESWRLSVANLQCGLAHPLAAENAAAACETTLTGLRPGRYSAPVLA